MFILSCGTEVHLDCSLFAIYETELILYRKAAEVTVTCPEPIAWTVDGELGGTTAEAHIRNCHRAIRILEPEEGEHA